MNATQAELALCIAGKLYVVVDSKDSGPMNVKSLVGPMGGKYILFTRGGRQELMDGKMNRTLWTNR